MGSGSVVGGGGGVGFGTGMGFGTGDEEEDGCCWSAGFVRNA
jgi:hypothetical protein